MSIKTNIDTIESLKRKSTLESIKYLNEFEYCTEAETIVSSILNKIISISIKEYYCQTIYKNINDYCYDFLKNQINLLLKEKYISYEEGKFTDKNSWIEIKEPENIKNDRYESNKINIISFDRKKIYNENNEFIENNKKIKKREFHFKIKKKTIPKISDDNNNKRKIVFLPIQSYDIPNIEEEFNNEKYDVENIKDLRTDVMNQILKKEKERKRQLLEEQLEKKLQVNKQINKNYHILDSSKYTFDSNGKIFSFKKYNMDTISKEFFQLQNKVKTLYIKENKENPSFRISVKKSNSPDKEKNTINQKPTIIKKTDYEKEHGYNFNDNYLFQKISPEKLNNEIIPSGNNYKLILPNVGVNIKYPNEKEKKGKKNFTEHFNKYTLNDYEKILNEYIPKKNIVLSSSFENNFTSNNLNNNRNNNNINKMNFNYNFNDNNDNFNRSLIQSPSSRTLNYKSINDNIDNDSSFTSSRFISNQLSHKTIKLNPTLNSSSLKLKLDNLSNLNNSFEEQTFLKKSITVKNLFKNKLNRNLSEKRDVSDINIFNSKIIRNINWGKNNSENNNLSLSYIKPSKPNKSSFLREFGRNLLGKRIKLPRQRKIKINI